MLSDGERRALEEIEQLLEAETREARQARVTSPPGEARAREQTAGHRGARRLAASGAGVALVLLVVGVPVAAGAVGTATAAVWLLWRYWAQLRDTGETGAVPPSAERLLRRADRRRRRRDLAEYLWRKANVE